MTGKWKLTAAHVDLWERTSHRDFEHLPAWLPGWLEALAARVDLAEEVLGAVLAVLPAGDVLDADGAAGLLGVARRTVLKRARAGTIPYARMAGEGQKGVRFSRTVLEAWVRRGCPAVRPGTSRLHSVRHAPGVPGRGPGKG